MASSIYARAGSIIGFSGRYPESIAINLCTLGIPFWSLSHVGIVAYSSGGRKLLFESTSAGPPCEIAGEPVDGVQAHRLSDVVRNYNGRVWMYPLYRPLYVHENDRLTDFLMKNLGVPYDNYGAKCAAGVLLSGVCSLMRAQDLFEQFCSELVSSAMANVGLFATTNASRWNPNHLMRTMRRHGVVCKPIRLK